MKVAVTGGSGVVGTAVTRHLVAEGHDVRTLARSSASAGKLAALDANVVAGDVLDPASLARLVSGAEWVFHVAGVNEMCPRSPDRMWRVNVEGTANVLGACLEAGVSRLVHTSSAATIGQRDDEVGTEETEHRGWFLSDYERSKWAAEATVLEGAGALEVVVVNPSSVQGPGRSTGTGRLFLSAARARLRFAVDTVLSIVDIDDCARGHLLAARHGAPGQRYILSGSTVRVDQALSLLGEVTGVALSPRYVPAALLSPIGAVVEVGARLLRRQAPLCRELARVLLHSHIYDGSRAARELGLTYRPIIDTIARTVDWFRSEGLVEDRG